MKTTRVVNNTFIWYCQYQYQYLIIKVLGYCGALWPTLYIPYIICGISYMRVYHRCGILSGVARGEAGGEHVPPGAQVRGAPN